VRADSAYSVKYFQVLLSLGGFESLIHEKGTLNHPLNETSKKLNRIKSIARSCVENVFGCMTMSMGGKLSRKIGLPRNEAWLGLKNLTFNFLRFLQCSKAKNKLWRDPRKGLLIKQSKIMHLLIARFHQQAVQLLFLCPEVWLECYFLGALQ
jgi:hypothetical protein